MRFIPLTKDQFAIVDDEDFELLSQHKWYAHKNSHHGWSAARSVWNGGDRYIVLMHREIMGALDGQFIDHRNRNTLDNERGNLRFCTKRQNAMNQGGHSVTASGYKGAYLGNKGKPKPWTAKVGTRKNGILYGGCFATPEEAARKYDEMAIQLYGEFACLNFPDEHQP